MLLTLAILNDALYNRFWYFELNYNASIIILKYVFCVRIIIVEYKQDNSNSKNNIIVYKDCFVNK